MSTNPEHLSTIKRLGCMVVLSIITLSPLLAGDGVVEINQARALAGGITPLDAPGFPVTLSERGSYRLTSNLDYRELDGVVTAISIAASGVTIDLNGFSVIGPTVCTGYPVESCSPTSDSYPSAIESRSHLNGQTVIRNGTVRGSPGRAVLVQRGSVVEDVAVTHNARGGVAVSNGPTLLRRIRARLNGGQGVLANGTVEDSLAEGNQETGFYLNGASVASRLMAVRNGDVGVECRYSRLIDSLSHSNKQGQVNLAPACAYSGNIFRMGSPSGGPATVNIGIEIGPNVCDDSLCETASP